MLFSIPLGQIKLTKGDSSNIVRNERKLTYYFTRSTMRFAFIHQFGDIMTADEVLEALNRS